MQTVQLYLFLLFEVGQKQHRFYHQLGMCLSKLVRQNKHLYQHPVPQLWKYRNQQRFLELPDFHYQVSNNLLIRS